MSTFLNALQKNNKGPLPVWFMRQAGRYLPEYMAIKNKSNFREMSHTPALMAEVTLQPLRRYPLDAAIMFSDILTCLEYMGAPFEFRDSGPKLDDHGAHVLAKLTEIQPSKDLHFVGEGIQLIKQGTTTPVVGFVGAPFTLISYLVEGGTSKEFIETKKLLFQKPSDFKSAMTHISSQLLKYLNYQVKSGVSAVQLFDSWVGVLSQKQYQEHILPHMQNLISSFKSQNPTIPLILYSQPTFHLLELLAESGADALSIDWRASLVDAARKIPKNMAIQGNLDPIVTTLDWENAQPHVKEVLLQAQTAEILDRYIFNVGHGVTPHTKAETLGKIVELVHTYKQ